MQAQEETNVCFRNSKRRNTEENKEETGQALEKNDGMNLT
jgi:hypothetical protein